MREKKEGEERKEEDLLKLQLPFQTLPGMEHRKKKKERQKTVPVIFKYFSLFLWKAVGVRGKNKKKQCIEAINCFAPGYTFIKT